jgi:hypothetical protein
MVKGPTAGRLYGMIQVVNLIKGTDKGGDGLTSGYSTKCISNF